MKKEIIGDEEHNVIGLNKYEQKNHDLEEIFNRVNFIKMQMKEIYSVGCACPNIDRIEEKETYSSAPIKSHSISGFFKSIGYSIKGLFSKKSQ